MTTRAAHLPPLRERQHQPHHAAYPIRVHRSRSPETRTPFIIAQTPIHAGPCLSPNVTQAPTAFQQLKPSCP